MQSVSCLRLLTAGVLFAAAARAGAADLEAPKGFDLLFNGKDLTGWHGWDIHSKGAGPYDLAKLSDEERAKKIEAWTADSKKHWSVENAELVNDGKGAYLATDKDYGDIELLIEYKTVAKADSGIYLRATPQVQIWDYTKEGGKWNIGADKGSGGLWNNSAGAPGKDPAVLADKPFGEWNSFRIVMVGERVSVWLNGKHVVDHARLENFWTRGDLAKLEADLKKLSAAENKSPDDEKKLKELEKTVAMKRANRATPLPKKAPILLQTHGGEIRWRNVFIREIPPSEANVILNKHNNEGFASVFNGKDFDGWDGPVDQYEVVDGAIVCKPKKGGTIYTKEEFADFVARVEFKLPPAGNNGLAIRYPGKGDTAYVGMCELQILDDDAKQYVKLDPRQYCCSAYGMAPVVRGYLRNVGEWNYEEATIKGSTIKVELNGTVVLDCDLSKITDYMAKSAHPGKDRTSGHFGFAGHNDPVAFRNIQIKKLDAK